MTSTKETQKFRALNRVFCICYSIQLQKDNDKDVLALPNSKSKVNAMTPAYAA